MANREIKVFSLSLLDVLFCAFGGVIVLTVIFSAIIKYKASEVEPEVLYMSVSYELDEADSTSEKLIALQFKLNDSTLVKIGANPNGSSFSNFGQISHWAQPGIEGENELKLIARINSFGRDIIHFQPGVIDETIAEQTGVDYEDFKRAQVKLKDGTFKNVRLKVNYYLNGGTPKDTTFILPDGTFRSLENPNPNTNLSFEFDTREKELKLTFLSNEK